MLMFRKNFGLIQPFLKYVSTVLEVCFNGARPKFDMFWPVAWAELNFLYGGGFSKHFENNFADFFFG